MKQRLQGLIAGLLIATLIFGVITVYAANSRTLEAVFGVSVVLNGERQTFPEDIQPFTADGRTYLPVRGIADALGLYMEWDGDTRTVYLSETPITTETDAQAGETMQFGGRNWLVLEVRDGHALLLHEAVIVIHPYHDTQEEVTWETSSSREWLNGEFFNSFSAADRARIRETAVINSDNPWWGTDGGNDTTDRIFLLSIDEVGRYLGGSDLIELGRNESNRDDDSIDGLNWVGIWEGSDYRLAYNDAGWASWWWLRSSGEYLDNAAIVTNDGWLLIRGGSVAFNLRMGLRPALWLNLES